MKPPKKTPCKECPFRRTSARGYLGGHTVDEFLQRWNAEQIMECHMTVDYESEVDHVTQILEGEDVRACAGAVTMMANDCRLPRASDYPRLKPDLVKVFRNRQEFRDYHDTPMHRAFIASLRKGEQDES